MVDSVGPRESIGEKEVSVNGGYARLRSLRGKSVDLPLAGAPGFTLTE